MVNEMKQREYIYECRTLWVRSCPSSVILQGGVDFNDVGYIGKRHHLASNIVLSHPDKAYFGPLRYKTAPAKIGKSSRTTSEALSNDAKFSYNLNLEAILNKIQKEKKEILFIWEFPVQGLFLT